MAQIQFYYRYIIIAEFVLVQYELIMHWLSKNSKLKELSSKPFRVTTTDALIVSVVSLVVTMIVLWMYYYYKDTPDDDRLYWTSAWQTVAVCMAAQYLYEYSGVNNMISESSIRYAKGTTLEKYTNTRDAILYKTMWYVPDSLRNDPDVISRFHVLQFVINNPDTASVAMKTSNKRPSELSALTHDELEVVTQATIAMNDAVIYRILTSGYESVTLYKGLTSNYIDDTDAKRDFAIRQLEIN